MRGYLARGNTEVFRELAPLFGSFLAAFEQDREPDLQRLECFLAGLSQGESTPDHVSSEFALLERGGQSRLADALRHLYRAKFEPDAKRKAERILLANAQIGMHEQTRLQTYICGALDAPVRRLLTRDGQHAWQVHALSAASGSWFSRQAENVFRRFATERVLTLSMPDSQLRLGRDLCAAPGQPLIPHLLQDIEHPELDRVLSQYAPFTERPRPAAKLPRPSANRSSRRLLLSLDAPFSGINWARGVCREGRLEQPQPSAARGSTLTRFHGQPKVARGTGARDWASLHQRMRFILQLFRSRQRNQRLLEPTFSAAQVDVLKLGRIPHGPLT
jgi:hypothetical protein